MSHQRVTPSDSDDMPKIPQTIRRKGVYHFNGRYPIHLTGPLNGNKTHRRESLKTSDWKEAKAKAARLSFEFQLELEELERKWKTAQEAEASSGISFESLSDDRKREIILTWFIQQEKESDELRHDLETQEESALKSERLGDALADFGSLNSLEEEPMTDWAKYGQQILKKQGIDANQEQLGHFAGLLRRASIEVQRRTLDAVDHLPTSIQPDPFFAESHSHSPLPERPQDRNVSELCEKYEEHKRTVGVSVGALNKYQMQFRIVKEFFGEDTGISAIGVEQAQALADFLAKIPLNATQRYPKVTLPEAAAQESLAPAPKLVSAKTQQDYLQGISALFRHALELDWIQTNPISKRAVSARLPKPEEPTTERFTTEEFTRFFTSQDFLKNRDHPKWYPRFWIPLLCFFHGLRANEACQLLVEDVRDEDPIPHLLIRDKNDAGVKVKQLKTTQSNRRMPLSQEFLKTGFLEFVATQRNKGNEWLFDSLDRNERGSRADGIGKWFSRFKKQFLDDPSPGRGQKSMHSLRHSFRRAGRDAGIQVPVMEALGGWTDSAKKSSEAGYGSGYGLPTLKEALDNLTGSLIEEVDLRPIQNTDSEK